MRGVETDHPNKVRPRTAHLLGWVLICVIGFVQGTTADVCSFADYYYMRLLKLDSSKLPEIPYFVRISDDKVLVVNICPRGENILEQLCPGTSSQNLVGIYLDEKTQKCLGHWTKEKVHGWTMHEEDTGSVMLYLPDLPNEDPGLISLELNYKADSPMKASPVVYRNFGSPDQSGVNIKLGVQDVVLGDSTSKWILKLVVSGAVNNVFWILAIGLFCNSRTKFFGGKIAPLNLLMIFIICDRTNNGALHVLDVLGFFRVWVIIGFYFAYILQFVGMYWIFQNTSPMNTYNILLPLFIGISVAEWLWDCVLSTLFLLFLNLMLLAAMFSFKKLIKSKSKAQEWSLCVALAIQVPIALQPWLIPYKSSRFRLVLHGLQAMYTNDDFILRYSLQNFLIIFVSVLRYGSMLLKDRSEEQNYKHEIDQLKDWIHTEHTPNPSVIQVTAT